MYQGQTIEGTDSIPSTPHEEANELAETAGEESERHTVRYPDRARTPSNHADSLRKPSEQIQKMKHLEEGTAKNRAALTLHHHGHPDHSMSLNNIGGSLDKQFEQTGTGRMDDLDDAIAQHREALLLHPPGHPNRYYSLNKLGNSLCERFNQTRKMEDLEEAIAQNREALLLRPPGHFYRSDSLNNLGNSLRNQFKQRGKIEDLEDAIEKLSEALLLCPPGHPDRSDSLDNLGISLDERFKQTAKMEDLEEAIVQHREALLLRPPSCPDRSLSLNNLGKSLHDRFERTGKMEDLEEAIAQHREALLLRPPGHFYRSDSLNNLSISLRNQFKQRGKIEDLEDAIEKLREALLLCPPGHRARSDSLDNLGISLDERFKQTAKMEDLEDAIVQHREALLLRPPGCPDRSLSLNNLGKSLHDRFERTGKMEDLEGAIAQHLEALFLRPIGHLDRSVTLYNLGNSLNKLFEIQYDHSSSKRIPVERSEDPLSRFPRAGIRCLDGLIRKDQPHAVATGGYADIYKGHLRNMKVAIKVVRPFNVMREKLLRRLWREYWAWSRLSHPNILQCLGYSYDFSMTSDPLPSLISPWMEHGTIRSYLFSYPQADRMQLLRGIADGLCYLHNQEPAIIYGDLRAANMLVSAEGVPFLGDFGLSRVFEDTVGMTTSSDLAGSLRWMAPELFHDQRISTHSDVWAYGMTILEILSEKPPYSEVKNDVLVFGLVKDGKTPSRPQAPEVVEMLSDQIWNICEYSWRLEPRERPSMRTVACILFAFPFCEASMAAFVARERTQE